MKTYRPARAPLVVSVTLIFACGFITIQSLASRPGSTAAGTPFPMGQDSDPQIPSLSPSQSAVGSEGVLKISV